MKEGDLKFRAISLSKENLKEKYNIEFTDQEWGIFKSHAGRSWEEGIEEFRLLISKHVRHGLSEIGFKPTLEDGKFGYKRKE